MRDGQRAMAQAIAELTANGGNLVVEAGTGVGKTFAYLVPALLSGQTVLLSTATKTLQDQLFHRDLPQVAQALGLPVRAALLKGRASYLCQHRLTLARHAATAAQLPALAGIESWSLRTHSGDLGELPDLEPGSALADLVSSTRDNCLGQDCPQHAACHVNRARREAREADIVVINHHLFFSDLALRETGVAQLLPAAQLVVFDEAHQLNDIAVQFLGVHLGSHQLLALCRELLATGLQQARGLLDWQHSVGRLEQATRALQACVGAASPGSRREWTGSAPEGLYPPDWRAALQALLDTVLAQQQGLAPLTEIGPDLQRLEQRLGDLAALLQHFAKPCGDDAVRWLTFGRGHPPSLRLVESPLSMAQALASLRMASASACAHEQSWVFTSATLGHDERLSWFTQSAGLSDAQVLRVPSPFDYAHQAALFLPRDMPLPSDPRHASAVAAAVARWASVLGGRTLVLTTTLRSMQHIGEQLAALCPRLEVLVQGQWPRQRLMQRFREGGAGGQRGCVLVASVSFWEGFDVPGQALQLVVVDKLPFPVPSDPQVQARCRQLEAVGRDPFKHYFLPEAGVALKQGAGRLIRHEGDEGVLVVCDARLTTKPYGKRLLGALPTMHRLGSEAELLERLAALATRTSTTP